MEFGPNSRGNLGGCSGSSDLVVDRAMVREYALRVSRRRVWAEIDLDAIQKNLAAIQARIDTGVRIMMIIKADAYGHGAVGVAHHAVKLGVSAFGVGTSAEALELRDNGIRSRILVLGTVVDEEVASVLEQEIDIGIHSSDRILMLDETARRMGCRGRVHLNIDTGMGRLGVLPENALRLLQEIKQAENLELAGIMSHVSSARGMQDESTLQQIQSFESVLSLARRRQLCGGWIHMANSACVFTGMTPIYDTVRPGISALGILPGCLPGSSSLTPAMSLRSQVVFIKDVPAGKQVGYDSTWTARQQTRIATLPLGYNDGVSWRLGNRGEVLLRGQRAPIIGRVSMDYTTVDVTHIRGACVGDEVVLFGRMGTECLDVEEVARKASTIAYEITCSVGKRVQRVFCGGESIELTPLRPSHAQRDPGQASTLEAPGALPIQAE
jgi:alanine racemase